MPWKVCYLPKVHKYLSKLSNKNRSKIKAAIEHLEQHGPLISPALSKKIKKDLFELRIKGQDSYRIFYTKIKSIYYLVHIFKKKSQKIPQKEIKTALDRVKQII